MEIIAYALPFFLAVCLLILCKKRMVWWEYFVLIGGSILLTLLIETLMKSSNTDDIEYLGGYMTKITHYDDWDEWIHRTCTRQVPDGTDSKGNTKYRTETYDCSYREYHPERWTYTDEVGDESFFYSKQEFYDAMKELGEPRMVFRDMHRHYYTKDGDAQDYFWDGTIPHLRSLTWKHTYTNKIIASSSVMKFKKISPEEAKGMGLYHYPNVKHQDQNPIIGITVDKRTLKQVQYINSFYGRRKQFRLYILVWTDKTIGISEEQRSYWQGGNKNEFVVCLGYDILRDSVKWASAFSWSDDPQLEIATKRYFRDNPKMDLVAYSKWLENHIGMWHRKEFKDFDYLTVNLTDGQKIGLFILTILFNIMLAIVLINNQFENTNIYDTSIDVHRFGDYLLSKEPKLAELEKKYRHIRL